jgi:hypothetical protein
LTLENRYPDLFRSVAALAPDAQRLLSFGCSTGEELISLRHWFPAATIVGAEINERSRRIARKRVAVDPFTEVVGPAEITGEFDVIFALAVFQREPHQVAETRLKDLSKLYAFARFDSAVAGLVRSLSKGGLLCVTNAQYRVEDSSAAALLTVIAKSPDMSGPLFGPDGRLLAASTRSKTLFQKV